MNCGTRLGNSYNRVKNISLLGLFLIVTSCSHSVPLIGSEMKLPQTELSLINFNHFNVSSWDQVNDAEYDITLETLDSTTALIGPDGENIALPIAFMSPQWIGIRPGGHKMKFSITIKINLGVARREILSKNWLNTTEMVWNKVMSKTNTVDVEFDFKEGKKYYAIVRGDDSDDWRVVFCEDLEYRPWQSGFYYKPFFYCHDN